MKLNSKEVAEFNGHAQILRAVAAVLAGAKAKDETYQKAAVISYNTTITLISEFVSDTAERLAEEYRSLEEPSEEDLEMVEEWEQFEPHIIVSLEASDGEWLDTVEEFTTLPMETE